MAAPPDPWSAPTLAAAFDAAAARWPDRLAVATPDERLSFAGLRAESDRIASALHATRSSPRVALLFGHGTGQVAAILGVLRSGRSYVPLDPAWPTARQAAVIASAGADTVLAESSLAAAAGTLGVKVLLRDSLPHANGLPPMPTAPDAEAYVLHTSGSTGHPKPVAQTHGNVLGLVGAWARRLGLQPSDRLSLLSTYGYDAAVQDIFGALLSGAELHPLDLRRQGRQVLIEHIASAGLSVLHATPTVYRHLFGGDAVARQEFPKVRLVVLGGEVARRPDLDLFRSRFRRGCRLVNGYGLTELTAVLQHWMDHDSRPYGAVLPIGAPDGGVPGPQSVRLLDEEGRDAAVVGEIALASPWLAPIVGASFSCDPAGASPPVVVGASFSCDPAPVPASSQLKLAPTGGGGPAGVTWWRTGDLARRLPDGTLAWVGRKDAQIKLGGVRIEPGEIETILSDDPAVGEAAVGLWSEGIEPRLVAWVTPSGAGTPDFESLRQRLAERLPPSHRPSYIGVLEALPKRANGKLDRAALPVPPTNHAAGNSAPVGARFSCDPAAVPALSQLKRAPTMSIEVQAAAIPAGSPQAVLTEIWSELLGIPAPRSDDDFFALGGHSLLAMRLVARLKDRLQIDLPLIAIFEHPTISGLAPIVASLRPSDAVGPIRRRRRGPKPGGTP